MEDGFVAWETQDINIVDDITAAHHDVNTWLMRSGTRLDAERLLANTPTGTFLIRRRDAGHYALSITCNSATNHCLIYETDKGYGFALPYNIYESLLGLVLHYAQNSLEEHNDALTTTLKYPVYSEFTSRYKQQQQVQKKLQIIQQQQHQPQPYTQAIQNDLHKMPLNETNNDETTTSLQITNIFSEIGSNSSLDSATSQTATLVGTSAPSGATNMQYSQTNHQYIQGHQSFKPH